MSARRCAWQRHQELFFHSFSLWLSLVFALACPRVHHLQLFSMPVGSAGVGVGTVHRSTGMRRL